MLLYRKPEKSWESRKENHQQCESERERTQCNPLLVHSHIQYMQYHECEQKEIWVILHVKGKEIVHCVLKQNHFMSWNYIQLLLWIQL